MLKGTLLLDVIASMGDTIALLLAQADVLEKKSLNDQREREGLVCDHV